MSSKNSFAKVILTKGVPASGKSTWAKEQVRKDPFRTCRINRDDLREMMSNYTISNENEELVTSVRNHAICAALKKGYSTVIVDETNLDKRAFSKMVSLIKKLNINCEIIEKPFYISFDEAVKRNAARDRVVPDNIMKKMWSRSGERRFKGYEGRSETILANEWSEDSTLSKTLADDTLPKCILVDLDGTISLFNKPGENHYPFAHERNPYNASTCNYDSPNMPVIKTVELFYDAGYKIIFCSGREDRYKPQTQEFLKAYLREDVEFSLYMRQTGDTRKDSVIKEQILKQNVAGKFSVFFALDDRNMIVDHYRNVLKINTWQVAPGDF